MKSDMQLLFILFSIILAAHSHEIFDFTRLCEANFVRLHETGTNHSDEVPVDNVIHLSTSDLNGSSLSVVGHFSENNNAKLNNCILHISDESNYTSLSAITRKGFLIKVNQMELSNSSDSLSIGFNGKLLTSYDSKHHLQMKDFITSSNHRKSVITIKYDRNSPVAQQHGNTMFEILITSYNRKMINSNCPDSMYYCDISDVCISFNLVCDGLDNCGNNKDERNCPSVNYKFQFKKSKHETATPVYRNEIVLHLAGKIVGITILLLIVKLLSTRLQCFNGRRYYHQAYRDARFRQNRRNRQIFLRRLPNQFAYLNYSYKNDPPPPYESVVSTIPIKFEQPPPYGLIFPPEQMTKYQTINLQK